MSDESPEKSVTPAAAAPPEAEETATPAEDGLEPEGPAEPEDAMSPEAIAKRVAAFGEEDEVDKIARLEEAKLAERRLKTKGGKKRAGLEAAASKRLSKIGAGKAPPPRVAVATDADPLLARTGQMGKWLRANQKLVNGIAAVAVIGAVGFAGWTWWHDRMETKASNAITDAVLTGEGRIGDPDKAEDEDKPKDPRPMFKTEADRREAAIAKYREVESSYKGTGAAYLARLEEGSLLLDKGDLDGAIAAYTEASTTPLAAADAEVKGRALEGLGFAYEAKAAAGDKDKWLDQAAQQFRALENTDVKGFKELGLYHQSRVAEAKGDKAKAIELLKALRERIVNPSEVHPFPYLETASDDRLRMLDPTALPPKQAKRPGGPGGMGGGPNGMGGPGGPGGGGQMDQEQMQRIIEQLKKQAEQQGGGNGSPMPMPAPPK